MKTNPSERGQTLVLIALALIAIFGFAALAIDGGRLYSERRRAQNAADSAAYAAASAAVDGNNAYTAALVQAELNGYLDAYPAADPSQYMDVMVYNPPLDGPYASVANNLDFYQVKIRTRVDQAFSQIIYPNGLEIQVEAVSHLQGSKPPGGPDAIRATSPTACGGIKFHGNSGVRVHGGNITADSTSDGTHGTSCVSILNDGLATSVTVTGGSILSVGSQLLNEDIVTATGGLHPGADIPGFDRVEPPPSCVGLTQQSYHSGNATLQPGIYANGIKISGKSTEVLMMPGIYCLDGGTNGGLIVTGGSLKVARESGVAGEPGVDPGVIIYIREGSVDLGGQGAIQLWSPQDLLDHDGTQWAGMLFYMKKENTGTIHITGGAGTTFYGTIYAPDPANPETQDKCMIEGTSAPYTVNSAIYCYTIKIGGRASVQVSYKAGQNYQNPKRLELSQ